MFGTIIKVNNHSIGFEKNPYIQHELVKKFPTICIFIVSIVDHVNESIVETGLGPISSIFHEL